MIFVGDKPEPVTGTTWMDHEFGSNQLTADQSGWDWFSIQLDDNRELMLYLLRRADGTIEKASSGTIINADGTSKHILLNEFTVKPTGSWKSPHTHGTYPMGWHLSVPSANIEIDLEPNLLDQELITGRSTGVSYWEGSVTVRSPATKAAIGQGYVEMTGYSEKFKQKI
jgi:predicted secreted hydrolase